MLLVKVFGVLRSQQSRLMIYATEMAALRLMQARRQNVQEAILGSVRAAAGEPSS